MELYKVCIMMIPGMTLTFFYGKASVGRLSQISGEHLQDHWSSGYVLGWDEILVKLLSEYVSQPL